MNAQNAIVIRDTPDKLVLASKIIRDIDKAKPEVLIHVQVLSANRRPPARSGNPAGAERDADVQSACTAYSRTALQHHGATTTSSQQLRQRPPRPLHAPNYSEQLEKSRHRRLQPHPAGRDSQRDPDRQQHADHSGSRGARQRRREGVRSKSASACRSRPAAFRRAWEWASAAARASSTPWSTRNFNTSTSA